jgi:integrase
VALSLKGSNPFLCAKAQPFRYDEFIEYLKSRRLEESTIEAKLKLVKHLAFRFNLWESNSIRKYIYEAKWGGHRKNNAGYAYQDWCRWKGSDFKFEKFREETQALPYIPLEKELDQLIAGFGPTYSCLLQLIKESGFRLAETLTLRVSDVDFERSVITLNSPAKHSNPRQFRMSSMLNAMLRRTIAEKRLNERIWEAKPNSIRCTFVVKRRYLANKLGNPRLLKISIRTFRHWKATMEYHRTKDILYVKELLGHKSIKNTLVYTHLVSFEEENAFIIKVASTIDEFTKLLESGFEYVSDFEGKKVLRKRK